MDIDDPVEVDPQDPPPPLLSAARDRPNPFPLLNDNFTRRYHDEVSDFGVHAPSVSNPREAREIPIEFKDGNGPSGNSGHGPVIEDVTGRDSNNGPTVCGTAIVDEADDDITAVSTAHVAQLNVREEISSHYGNGQPSAPVFDNSSDFTDIEEEMIRAAIEASKRDIEGNNLINSVCNGFPILRVCFCIMFLYSFLKSVHFLFHPGVKLSWFKPKAVSSGG